MTDAGVSTENRCYRHPDRETFVRCQRCGRPICGQCQTLAPVGVHCPECVRDARGSVASARPLGRRFANTFRPGSGRPVVTLTIVGINVVIFVVELLTGTSISGSRSGSVENALAYYPGAIAVTPWTLITNAFVHVSLIHLALNMFSLFIFGLPLERYLGRLRYIALYLISTIGADVAIDFLSRDGGVGASGAIFGLIGLLFLFWNRIGFNITWLVVITVVNLGSGFVDASISWQAHLGGLVTGLLVGVLLRYTASVHRRQVQLAGLIALPVLFLLVLFAHVFL